MLKRTSACLALILGATYAFAQNAADPAASTSGSAGSGSAPSAANTPPVNIASATTDQTTDVSESFTLPGGYGNAPLNFTPGQGHFDRPPLVWSTTVQQGYDDNVYDTSGSPLQKPVKGSAITNITEGVSWLLSQDRMGLSLDANVGAQYYWDRDQDQSTPTVGVDLIYAYKISPRSQLSIMMSAAYQTQTSYSTLNGLTDSGGKPYLTGNLKVDLLNRWTPLFSTDTTYVAYGTLYSGSEFKSSNHINQIIGESLRYSFSRNTTGILEGRVGQDTYDNSNSNSQSYYALAGADFTLTRRLSSAIRLGSQTRVNDNGDSNTMPYAEGSVNYILTRTTLLGWSARYGYQDTNASSGSAKSFRTGLTLTQSITPKLKGTLSANFEHDDALISDIGVTNSNSFSTFMGTVGLNYAYTKDLTLFANYSRIQKESPSDLVEYNKNVYYIGATFQY